MSASMNWIACSSAIGRPNAVRPCAQASASSSAARSMPVPGGDGDAALVEQAERLLEALVLLADQVPSPAIDARLVNRLTESNARLLQRRRPGAQDRRSHRTVCDGAMTPRRLHYAMSRRGTPFFP